MRISDWSSDVCSSDLWSSRRVGSRSRAAMNTWMACRYRRSTLRPGNDNARVPGLLWRALLLDGCSSAAACTPRSEEHTSDLQSLMRISYAVFCLKNKKKHTELHLTYT